MAVAGRLSQAWVVGLALDLASFQHQGMRESQTQLGASFGRSIERRRLRCVLAAELGGGVALQRTQSAEQRSSGLLSLAAVVEGDVRISRHWLASLLVRAPATFLRLDGATTARFLPAAWAGATYAW